VLGRELITFAPKAESTKKEIPDRRRWREEEEEPKGGKGKSRAENKFIRRAIQLKNLFKSNIYFSPNNNG
jgi:hypothetical protein